MASANIKPSTFDRVASFISNLVNKPQPIMGINSPVLLRGLPIYPNPNTLRFVNDGYCGNATIYTVISTACRKFGFLPRYVYKITDKSAATKLKGLINQREYKYTDLLKLFNKAYNEQVVDNAFAELLARPNNTEGQDSFYFKCLMYYMITGETFIWLNRGIEEYDIAEMDDEAIDKTPPVEMYVMPSQYMELIADPDDVWGVVGYVFNQNGRRQYVRKGDIIHWKMPNPKFDAILRTHLRGLSPLEPGNKLTEQDESATDASVAMQQNDGAKAVIFSKQLMNMDAVQKTQYENVINRKLNNRDLKGSVATLQGEHGMLDLSMSSVDMQLVESQEKVFIKFCNLFGLDPNMFLQGSTYANKKEAKKDMITGLLLPYGASLRDEMNRVLLPAFGLDKSYTHDVDVSNLPELQDDMTEKVTQLAAAWWMTPNQKLEEMNEDRSPDPNMDKVWIPNSQVLMDDAAMTDVLNSFDNAGPNSPDSGGNNPDPLPKRSPKGN